MATTRDARGPVTNQNPATDSKSAPNNEQRLLWNPENVKDVAESVGIGTLGDEALRTLAQDVEYRLGQVIVEALRFMRAGKRTTMTVKDISLALKVLDVEPLYGYDSTRPLRYGEASLGPGQPLFYIEDEETDFEKLINSPLPKVSRDLSFTGMTSTTAGLQVLGPAVANRLFLQHTGSPWKASSHLFPKIPRRRNLAAKTYFRKALVPILHWLPWLGMITPASDQLSNILSVKS